MSDHPSLAHEEAKERETRIRERRVAAMARQDRDAEHSHYAEMMRDPLAVFVFGSNRRGVHGAGAARAAAKLYGAKRGVGEGMSGRSYAIPTKETWRDAGLPIESIASHVATFLVYARGRWAAKFVVTRIGCGLAGYADEDIAPLFRDAPANCFLPEDWRALTASGGNTDA